MPKKKNDEEIRKFLLDLICHIDYDHYKSYLPELSEDPEASEESMAQMITMVREFIK